MTNETRFEPKMILTERTSKCKRFHILSDEFKNSVFLTRKTWALDMSE